MHIMLKKLSLSLMATSAIACAASNAIADDYKNEVMAISSTQPLLLKDGFYIGAQGGYDNYRAGINHSVTVAGTSFVANPTLSSNGFVGGFFTGFGMNFYQYGYLAAELFGNGSTANQSYNLNYGTTSSTSKVTQDGDWGISVLPGIKVNPSSLVFLRLGWNQARLRGTETFIANGNIASASSHSWASGFNVGLGIETAIYQNISLRGEYDHTSFGSYTSRLGTKYTLSNNRMMAGLSYHFS
jgi:outer membrane immunogenic protein